LDLYFRDSRLQKACGTVKGCVIAWGPVNGKLVQRRLAELSAAVTLDQVYQLPQAGLHPLRQNRKGQFAVTVKQPYRLIFIPLNDPLPRLGNGDVDPSKITAVKILEVVDYHEE